MTLFRTLKAYPLSLLCVAAVWYLCLFRPPRTGLEGIAGIDKVVHVLMYLGMCGMMWREHRKVHPRADGRRTVPAFVVAPILMSGLIELLQEHATTYRSGDWMDFAANSLGVALAALAGNVLLPAWERRRSARRGRKKSGENASSRSPEPE